MAATDAEFQQNAPRAEQLPQGAASQLNEALPTTTPGEPEVAAAPAAEAVEPEFAMPQDYEPTYAPENEEDQFLVGPTLRPDEDITTGARYRTGLDNGVKASLPFLQSAAAEASSSEELRALVGLLLRESES